MRYLYRTVDQERMSDFTFEPHPAHNVAAESDQMRYHVMKAITKGSKDRSPFSHWSREFRGAAKYNYVRSGSRGYMCMMLRMDLCKLWEMGYMDEHLSLIHI